MLQSRSILKPLGMGLIGGVAHVSEGYALHVVPRRLAIITLSDIINKYDFSKSCIGLLNKLVFSPSKANSDINGTYFDFASNLNVNINKIKRSIISGKYEFSPYLHRSVRIGHKQRDIYLANWPDKLVERWLACGLNHCLSKWFSQNCYAYRPGEFGLDVCQNRVAKACKPNMYIIRRDISNYFYSIPHDKLLNILSDIVQKTDPLYRLLKERIHFQHTNGVADVGVPFGSPIACVLANIYLTNLDKCIEKMPVKYFRYADDFAIITYNYEIAKIAKNVLIDNVNKLGLKFKDKHTQDLVISPTNEHEGFTRTKKFKFLGLEFTGNSVRLGVEKQRKIINLFSRQFKLIKNKLKKFGLNERIEMVAKAAEEVISSRIRSAAIIDYYIKHVTDINQLKEMDMLIAKAAISAILNKKFKYKDFSIVKYKQLRSAGLTSLVHRHRLHRQGHIRINFLSLYNELIIKRHKDRFDKRRNRIEQIKLSKKLANCSTLK